LQPHRHRGWGADSNLFHQGVAKETDDPEIVAATMAKSGVVLRRPVGSNGPFKQHAELPTELTGDEAKAGRARRRSKSKGRAPAKISDKQARKAALEFEREQKQRDAERRKEDAARRMPQGRRNASGARRRLPRHRPR
jgi:type II secretory pathway component HofQ